MQKEINGIAIELSHLDKIWFPESDITKGTVIQYYEKIADYFLSHVKNHLIVMHRFPDGISGENFYQKQIPDYFPRWIKRKEITLKKGEKQTLALVEKAADLIYMANQGVLVFHAWMSSIDKVDYPDQIFFDLDPEDSSLEDLRFAARKIREVLEKHHLKPFIKTTGLHGYHVVAPIFAQHPFEKVYAFAKSLSVELVNQYPDKLSIDLNKESRKRKIYIDLRDSYGQTGVAPYSLRAAEGAPVATPIDWDELSEVAPNTYTMHNIFKRLGQRDDAWKNFEKERKAMKL
ncbi:MAG: non-homologous end-joining DNA ligase [Candidatus Babeliaceae bacterium]|nr:non-homologous end-joining DNA ligase [Candidatus Babeliaceae bacterium]